MDELVIATGNPHKVAELRAILGGLGLRVVGLRDLEAAGEGPFAEPEETGSTFEANATIKALRYAEQTGRMCLADDSGLEIDALGGRPGVISSHYCTDGIERGMSREQRDELNNERVLREMAGVAPEDRAARFVCVMVLAAPESGTGSQPVGGTGSQPVGGTGSQPVGGTGFQPVGGTGFQPVAQDDLPPAARRTFDGRFLRTRRKLPHWQAGNATYFVTFRLLHGSLTEPEREVVLRSIRHFDGDRYHLFAATVMPDHAHMLFRMIPRSENEYPTLSSIMHSIKSFTSNEIQRRRGARGALWQREYFDRLMRGAQDTEEKRSYIAMNPVRRGLCEKPRDYPYTYLYELGAESSRDRLEAGATDRLEAGATRDRLEAGATNRLEVGATDRLEAGATDRLEAGATDRLEAGATDRLEAGATQGRVLGVARGEFEGRIGVVGEVPRGENGFGYDPLFLVGPGYVRTSAEMDSAEKNALSHRARAAEGIAGKILEMFAR